MSDKDIVARAREFLNGPNYTVGDHLALLRALADEVERWRSGANAIGFLTTQELETIRDCDKCDLCEDHND